MAYAEDTKVPISRSKAEVEQLLRKAGATSFVTGWDDDLALSRIMCRLEGKMLRFEVTQPRLEDFRVSPGGLKRNDSAARTAVEKEERRRWRALVLIVKAKIEVIAMGYSTVEEEFLANILLPDNRTVGEWAGPKLAEAYEKGKMPTKLLPGG